MAIFHRRPLFLCCSVFLLACLTGYFLPSVGRLILFGCVAAVGALILLIHWARKRNLTAICIIITALILLFAGLFRSHLWFNGGETARLTALEGQTVKVTGTVTDRRGSGSYMTSYSVKLTSVNGENADGLALLTCHYVSDLQPGYDIEADVTVVSLEEAVGEGYDAAVLWGDGYITGLVSEHEEAVAIRGEHAGDLSVKIGALRRSLAATLNRLTPDGKGLPSALLLGDRSALSDSLRRDFARAGVSHLLAISGLHVTLLFGLLEGLLRLLRIPKKVRALLLLLAASGYLVLLGFPPSATRAVIMLGSVYLSYLLSARADPLTSLGLAGALILAVTPCAVADGGFWMSYLATLGLLTVIPAVNRKVSKADHASLLTRTGRVLRLFGAGLLVGLVAMSFTLPIVASAIKEMGILSPLSTLILTPFCGAVLVLSLLSLPFGGGFIGTLLGGFIEAICQTMEQIAAWMGSPSWVVIPLRHQYILPIAIGMLAAMLILLAVQLPDRKKWVIALPLLIGWTAIGGVLCAHSLASEGDMTVTFVQPSSASDMLVLTEGNEAVICDLSNGSLTAMNAATREAERSGATEIAVLMLTHYHSRTTGTLSAILSRETVRALWLPVPDTEDEYFLLLSYLEKAEAAGVPVHLYGEGEVLSLFGKCAVALDTDTISRSVQPVLLLSLGTKDNQLVYCGSAVFESNLAKQAAIMVSEADTVIFGNHGPLVKKPFGEDLTFQPTATVILSEEGDVAGWFVPDAITDQPLWLGEWTGEMEIGK